MRWSRPSTTCAVGQQLDAQVRERLLAVPARPPERRFGTSKTSVAASPASRWPRRSVPRRRRGAVSRAGGVPGHVDVHLDPTDAVDHRDEGPHRGQTGRAPAFDARFAPDAGGDEVGPPVPAVVAGHLADRVERVGIGVNSRLLLQARLLGGGQLGGEVDDQLGLSPPHEVSDIEPVCAVLVARGAEDAVAQPDLGNGVQPVEDQLDVLPVLWRGGGERRRIPPARPPDPLQGRLVLVEVRVGDQPGREQVGVDGAGDRRGDGTPGDLLRRRSVQRQQGPSGKGLCGHFTAPAVIPATKWRCTRRNPMTTGTLTTSDAAMIWFQ